MSQRFSSERKVYSHLTENEDLFSFTLSGGYVGETWPFSKKLKMEDFYIFRQVRLWSSLTVEAVETKHKFQKWILQGM